MLFLRFIHAVKTAVFYQHCRKQQSNHSYCYGDIFLGKIYCTIRQSLRPSGAGGRNYIHVCSGLRFIKRWLGSYK